MRAGECVHQGGYRRCKLKGATDQNERSLGKGESNGGGRVSFRDKVLGGATIGITRRTTDFLQENLAKVEFQDGNHLMPKVFFDAKAVEELSELWKDALVAKLLGKHLSYTAMREKLKVLWRLQAGFDIMDVGNDYFMVKFDTPMDRDKVIMSGPWMIQGCYVAIKEWMLNSTQVNHHLVKRWFGFVYWH